MNGFKKIIFSDCIGVGLQSPMTFLVINTHIFSKIIFKIKHAVFKFNTKHIDYIVKSIICKYYYCTIVSLYVSLILLCTHKLHGNNPMKIQNITSDKLTLL